MTLAAAVAVPVYAVRLGEDLLGGLRRGKYFTRSLGTMRFVRDAYDDAEALATTLLLLAGVAAALLIPCAVLWLVWGILSLNYGPSFRRAVGWLTALTLILGVFCVLPGWVHGVSDSAFFREDIELRMLSRAPEVIHALFLGLLLTRPGVKRLFARGGGTDDSD